jgi:hypothetical protein
MPGVVHGVGVDRDVALAWCRDHVQAQAGRNSDKTGGAVSNILAAENSGNGHGNGARLDPAQERARRDRVLSVKIELENERRSGELCEIASVVASVAEDYSVIRSQLASLGSKIAPRVLGLHNAEEIKAAIDAEVARILDELSEDDVYAEAKREGGGRP